MTPASATVTLRHALLMAGYDIAPAKARPGSFAFTMGKDGKVVRIVVERLPA
jgi:hypothetical protein